MLGCSDNDRVPSGREQYECPMFVAMAVRRVVGSLTRLLSTLVARVKFCWFGATVGDGLRVDGSVWVRAWMSRCLILGTHVTLISRSGANPVGLCGPVILDCIGRGRIEIGDGSGLSSAVVSARTSIVIGRNTLVGGNAKIFDHDFHSLDGRDRRDRRTDDAACATAPVRIGDDVLIGTGALILKGSTIGDRAVIGAGAVVSGDVPADEIWAGNPARRVRSLRE